MLEGIWDDSASWSFIRLHFSPSSLKKYLWKSVLRFADRNNKKGHSMSLRIFIRDGISLYLI